MPWVYNASKENLKENIIKSIDYCNVQDLTNFNKDSTKLAWTKKLEKQIKKQKQIKFSDQYIRTATFRPFVKHYLYADPTFIDMPNKVLGWFPQDGQTKTITTTEGKKAGFSTLISDTTPDIHVHEMTNVFHLI